MLPVIMYQALIPKAVIRSVKGINSLTNQLSSPSMLLQSKAHNAREKKTSWDNTLSLPNAIITPWYQRSTPICIPNRSSVPCLRAHAAMWKLTRLHCTGTVP